MQPVRRLLCFFTLVFALAGAATPVTACVGRTLYIGSLNTVSGRLMAEMLSLLINERTGTTVKVRFFDDRDQLYQALASQREEERADILVEDTASALARLHLTSAGDGDQDYLTVKDRYDQELGLVWLSPFGFSSGGKTVTAPLVRRDVLVNFPLLPRVLNKLAGAIDDETYAAMVKDASGGAKPKNVAKDFLRQRRFI